ncbi:MAG: zf-HC2 domain-containing protein [Gemmatimonadota bacterium]|nr:zf-HC2 domain-containing protein [Gemmatimonadota bacterium]
MSFLDRLRELRRQRRGHVMKCGETAEHLFEYLDDELDPQVATHLRNHLEVCAPCATRADFERAFLNAVKKASSAGEPIPDSVRRRVLQVLQEPGERGEPEEPPA